MTVKTPGQEKRYCRLCCKKESRKQCAYGGKLWDKYSAGEWKKSPEIEKKVEKFLESVSMRVPMDNPSGANVLKFKGFTNRKGHGILLHPRSMRSQGGADLDGRVLAIASNTSLTLDTGDGSSVQNSATAVTSVQMIRKRNQLRDQEKNLLLRKLRKDVIKTLKTDGNNNVSQTTQTFRRTFVLTSTASGELALTAGATETFSASSNTDCVVTKVTAGSAIGGSSNTGAAGTIVNLEASTTPAQTYVVSGNQLTITNPEIIGSGTGWFHILTAIGIALIWKYLQ